MIWWGLRLWASPNKRMHRSAGREFLVGRPWLLPAPGDAERWVPRPQSLLSGAIRVSGLVGLAATSFASHPPLAAIAAGRGQGGADLHPAIACLRRVSCCSRSPWSSARSDSQRRSGQGGDCSAASARRGGRRRRWRRKRGWLQGGESGAAGRNACGSQKADGGRVTKGERHESQVGYQYEGVTQQGVAAEAVRRGAYSYW